MFIYHIPQYGSFNYRRIFGHQCLLTHYTNELIALSLLKLRDTPPINIWGSNTLWFNYAVSSNGWGGRIWTCECRSQSPVPYRLATPQYLDTLLTYILHLALADSNGLLYVTKGCNSHSVSSLGQRLELFFNKLFSYFPLYFHLNFARGTVTIWINYFYKGKVTILWIRIFITTDRFPLIITVLVTLPGIEPGLREWKSRVLTDIR